MNQEQITIEGPGPLNPIGTPAPARPPIDWTKPVRTGYGDRVTIYAIDHSLKMPVVGKWEGSDHVAAWRYDGVFLSNGRTDKLDLENVPTSDSEAK